MRKIEALIQIAGEGWLRSVEPVRVVEAHRPDEVIGVLASIDQITREKGWFAVGFVAFEAAAAFGLTVRPSHDCSELPLVWFGFFRPQDCERLAELPVSSESYELGPLEPSLDRSGFKDVFERIKTHLADGDTYQVDYTFRVQATFSGGARALFGDLVTAQGGEHSAFIELGTHAVCSASPELFFSRRGTSLSARPMKGTAPRGRTLAEDRRRRDDLRASAKQRAENVMIVDMMRNDLGRVAKVGTIRVPELFTVERYPNVWQMTSLVTAETTASLPDLFAALHPPASVTGAPKVRTMEILSELEGHSRGVYTGAIGYVTPDGTTHFNVAIRTAVIDYESHCVTFGIGSGIVWDSNADDEYDECLLKSTVLGRRPVPFELLETMRWAPEEGCFLLDRHLQRMRESAEYFGFAFSEEVVLAALDRSVGARGSLSNVSKGSKAQEAPGAKRIRLLVSRGGAVRVEQRPFEPASGPLNVRIATGPVDTTNPFLFHKTTNREVYEKVRAGVPPGVDDVILWNTRDEVTEATFANVVVDTGAGLVTPPVECGLLAGTFRAEVLEGGKVREAIVTVNDLRKARRFWLINSVHEWREARL